MIVGSCTKPDIDLKDPDEDPPNTKTELELIADSIFLFSKEIYYWQDKIGSASYASFNPVQYVRTDALTTAESAIAAVRTYNIWDQTKGYSYAEPYSGGGTSSKAATMESGYGFDVKIAWKNRLIHPSPHTVGDPDFQGWYVSYVYPQSDAGVKGVQRGMKLVKINGKKIGLTVEDVATLNNMFYYETLKSVDAEFLKPNGDTLKINIRSTSHESQSVLYSNIFNTPKGKKVAYLVYKFFDRLSETRTELNSIFQNFKSQNVSAVILDMRYNNGGYTETQDFLTDHLAPVSVNNEVMYKYHFNENLQTGNYTILKTRYPNSRTFSPDYSGNTVKFNTTTSLNTSKVYVIVSDETASSSELLINNLKPILGNNLILIGDANTRGKPVGFFPIDLFKKVTFWTVSLMTKNKVGDAVSYDGFAPNYKVYDGVDKPWGDVTEDCTAAAIALIDGESVQLKSQASSFPRTVAPSMQVIRKRKHQLLDNMLFTVK